MKKYIIPFDDGASLQVNHRYSDDTILSRYHTKAYHMVYDRLEDAVAAQAGKKYAEPVFEVELGEFSELLTTVDLNEKINPYKITPPENIKAVLSATHGGEKYNLSAVWGQRYNYLNLNGLLGLHVKNSAPTPVLRQIEKLRQLLWSLQGELSYSELANILRESQIFLDNPSENLEVYKALAKKQKDAPSPAMQALGLCMLALAATVAAMGAGVILGVGAALAGCGLFAMGRRGTGVYKAMSDVSDAASVPITSYLGHQPI